MSVACSVCIYIVLIVNDRTLRLYNIMQLVCVIKYILEFGTLVETIRHAILRSYFRSSSFGRHSSLDSRVCPFPLSNNPCPLLSIVASIRTSPFHTTPSKETRPASPLVTEIRRGGLARVITIHEGFQGDLNSLGPRMMVAESWLEFFLKALRTFQV